MLNLLGPVHSCYKDVDEKLRTLRQQLINDRDKILSCLDDLGLICAYEVWSYSQFLKKRESMLGMKRYDLLLTSLYLVFFLLLYKMQLDMIMIFLDCDFRE